MVDKRQLEQGFVVDFLLEGRIARDDFASAFKRQTPRRNVVMLPGPQGNGRFNPSKPFVLF